MSSSGAAAVVKIMATLTTATEIAGRMNEAANSVCDTVTAVANKSHEILMKLTDEAASIAKSMVNDFRGAMREAEASGNGVKQRCLELSDKWNFFEKYIYDSIKRTQLGREEVQKCIQLLQLMLDSAAKCIQSYDIFKEKLKHAINIGSQLEKQCRVATEDAKSRASNTKLVGYGATGALGVAALGFLTFATGGLALVGAAAAGAAAAGAGAATYDRAGRLDELATEFDGLRGQLDGALGDLNRLGDLVTGLFVITETMVEKMEIALKLFMEHERLRQENENLVKRIQELEAGNKKT